MKRILTILMCLVMLFVSGCWSQKSTSDETADKTTAKKQTEDTREAKDKVILSFYASAPDDATKSYFNGAVERFHESNPNIEVEITLLPSSGADVNKKMNTAKISGMYPDVFVAFLNMIAPRGGVGEFAVLDDYIANWDGKDDVYRSVMDMGKLKGKQLALGFYPLPEVFAYRKDYFEEAGLDPEKPPKNWNELEEYAQKLVVRDDSGRVTRAGIDVPVIDGGSTTLEAFMRQNGSMVIDEANNKPAFTDDASIEALEFLGNLSAQNLTIPYDSTKSNTIPFINGNSAMTISNISVIKSMINNKPELEAAVGIAPVLENKERVAFCAQRFFTIGETSEHKDEAWEFVKFMMSKDEFWNRYKEMGVSPVRKSMEQQFIDDDPKINKYLLEYVEYGVGKPRVTWVFNYNKFISTAYEEVVTGKNDARSALETAYEGLKKELEDLNVK